MNCNSTEVKLLPECRSFAEAKMKDIPGSHGWDHVERVLSLCRKISSCETGADPFIVEISALLHDIARIDQDRSCGRICHAELGSTMAYEFLREKGLDVDRSLHVSECILTHRFRNHLVPDTIEARILYDADKLDSIGAVGIGRAFLFSGEIGARLHSPATDTAPGGAYSRDDTAYREYMVKLRHVKDNMLTGTGSLIAAERHTFMEKFFQQLLDEVRGDK